MGYFGHDMRQFRLGGDIFSSLVALEERQTVGLILVIVAIGFGAAAVGSFAKYFKE